MNGLAAIGAVVEGALIDVHADKAVGQAGVEVTGELHGVFQRLLAVIESMLDAVAYSAGDSAEGFGTKRAADGVAAKRQDEAGGFAPPDAEVDDLVQSAGGVGELALMDDEAGIVFAGENLGDDLVEGNDFSLQRGVEDFERQIGGGEGSGDGNLDFGQIVMATGDWRRPWGRSPLRRCLRRPLACSSPASTDRHES